MDNGKENGSYYLGLGFMVLEFKRFVAVVGAPIISHVSRSSCGSSKNSHCSSSH